MDGIDIMMSSMNELINVSDGERERKEVKCRCEGVVKGDKWNILMYNDEECVECVAVNKGACVF